MMDFIINALLATASWDLFCFILLVGVLFASNKFPTVKSKGKSLVKSLFTFWFVGSLYIIVTSPLTRPVNVVVDKSLEVQQYKKVTEATLPELVDKSRKSESVEVTTDLIDKVKQEQGLN